MDKRTILIVEDNADDKAFIMHALSQANAHNPLLFFTDGQEALEYLFPESEQTPKMPCMIILDLALPRLDGLQLLKELRASQLTRRIPVVVLTSSQKRSDITACYHQGANSYIEKPGSTQVFNEKIRYLCEYWLEICKLPAC